MAFDPDQLTHRLIALPPLPAILAGLALLLFGRRLFWLFVAALGFVIGQEAALALYPQQPDGALIAGLVLGLVCALLAVLTQKIAIGIAGFFAGGYFLMTALRAWEMRTPETAWIAFLIGGVIGASLMYIVFHWSLILFSSLSGAHLILRPFSLPHPQFSAVLIALVICGVLVQGHFLSARRRARG